MKKIFALLSLALCATIYAQKDKSYNNHWRESNNFDIKLHITEFVYSEEGKLFYYISNDNENIYLNLRIYDVDVFQSMMNSGLTTWINMNGKKAKKLGIKYPVGMQKMEKPENKNMPESGATPGGPPSGMMSLDKLELIGFGDTEKTIISPFANDNFRGSIKFEKNGNTWYELIMPISKLPEMTYKDKNGEASIILGIGYESISFPGQARTVGQQGMPSGGQGGGSNAGRPAGGGRPGGGAGGRAGAAGGPGPQTSSSPVIIWIKDIKLAAQK
jgi:hypothetical protein